MLNWGPFHLITVPVYLGHETTRGVARNFREDSILGDGLKS